MVFDRIRETRKLRGGRWMPPANERSTHHARCGSATWQLMLFGEKFSTSLAIFIGVIAGTYACIYRITGDVAVQQGRRLREGSGRCVRSKTLGDGGGRSQVAGTSPAPRVFRAMARALVTGLVDHAEIEKFLQPRLADLTDPFSCRAADGRGPDLAYEQGSAIWYTATTSGRCATALMIQVLSGLGAMAAACRIASRTATGWVSRRFIAASKTTTPT